MDLENYTIKKCDYLKSKNEIPGLCCNSGSLIARDRFPQEIWLKIFSYLKLFDLKKMCSGLQMDALHMLGQIIEIPCSSGDLSHHINQVYQDPLLFQRN